MGHLCLIFHVFEIYQGGNGLNLWIMSTMFEKGLKHVCSFSKLLLKAVTRDKKYYSFLDS